MPRLAVTTSVRHGQILASRAAARRELPLADSYTRALRRAGYRAATMFENTAIGFGVTAAAAGWQPPQPSEVYDLLWAQAMISRQTDEHRDALWQSQLAAWGDTGLSFDATNPLLSGAFSQLGEKITAISEAQRDRIMSVIDQSWQDGLSIRETATAIRQETVIDSLWRGTMIARTEIIGASNAASFGVVRESGAAAYKQWLASSDQFVRPDHADADGKSVPVDQPFDVGGYQMMYPGDPSGPPSEVINCRCSIAYSNQEP
jgi:hypothetical protein